MPSPRQLLLLPLFELSCANSVGLSFSGSLAAARSFAAVAASGESIAPLVSEAKAAVAMTDTLPVPQFGVDALEQRQHVRASGGLRGTRNQERVSPDTQLNLHVVDGNRTHAATTVVASKSSLDVPEAAPPLVVTPAERQTATMVAAATWHTIPTNLSNDTVSFENCDMACEQCFADHYQGCLAFCIVGCDDLCEVRLERPRCKAEERWIANVGHILNAMHPRARMCQATGINGCPRPPSHRNHPIPLFDPYAGSDRSRHHSNPVQLANHSDSSFDAWPAKFDEMSSSDSVRAAMASAAVNGASMIRPVPYYAST
eukprot:TRINITY_DN40889_c0_g1_i1.p1 TRINITY_DN40889_c0_g1~~TRINITY_DN40889_c0_g1_i1.p1  ORF type:complete len:315 (-),score=38.88 TRINITY_DN40889_c0_g1_i1:36-980(-)